MIWLNMIDRTFLNVFEARKNRCIIRSNSFYIWEINGGLKASHRITSFRQSLIHFLVSFIIITFCVKCITVLYKHHTWHDKIKSLFEKKNHLHLYELRNNNPTKYEFITEGFNSSGGEFDGLSQKKNRICVL